MIVTILPYLVAQTPVVFGWSHNVGSTFVLVGCAMSVIAFTSYCAYQLTFPWMQQRWISKAKEKVRRSSVLHRSSQLYEANSWGSLLLSDGVTPNEEVLGRIFVYFDQDSDGHLSTEELRGLITGFGIEHEAKIPEEEEIQTWMLDFNVSNDREISKTEFLQGMIEWMGSFVDQSKVPKRSPSTIRRIEAEAQKGSNGVPESGPHLFWSKHSNRAQSALTNLLQDQDDEDDDDEALPTKAQVIAWAVAYLVLGVLVAGAVTDPLIDAIGNVSVVTGISPFFISFVATPLAIGSSEVTSSLTLAMRRKKKNISMTYSPNLQCGDIEQFVVLSYFPRYTAHQRFGFN